MKSASYLEASARRTLLRAQYQYHFALVFCGASQFDSDSGVPGLPAITPPVVTVFFAAFSSLQMVQPDTASSVEDSRDEKLE